MWFEITHYDDKKEMTIVNLLETMWVVRYPWQTEITHVRES